LRTEAKVVATVFALSAFAVAVIAGLYAGNAAGTVLWRAIIAMLVCQVLGMFAGSLIERIITEHAARYSAEHPVPRLPSKDDVVAVVDEVVDEPLSDQSAAA